jgi:hypothetical protein
MRAMMRFEPRVVHGEAPLEGGVLIASECQNKLKSVGREILHHRMDVGRRRRVARARGRESEARLRPQDTAVEDCSVAAT